MPRRPRTIPGIVACLLLTGLVTGCTGDAEAVREPGAAVTADEADSLARLLQRNYQRGGADFVATAPYGSEVVLTLTGTVDFRRSRGTAALVTTYGDGRPDDAATLYFSADDLWVGDLPGLPEALDRAGVDGAYLRRPLDGDGSARLADVLARVVLNLGRAQADDPRGFRSDDWTWQGQRSIDSRLSAVFGRDGGPTVAVGAADDLLLQYGTPLPGQSFEMTVTLADHGPASVTLPDDAASVDLTEHPELAALTIW
jgi:hypothetical protein